MNKLVLITLICLALVGCAGVSPAPTVDTKPTLDRISGARTAAGAAAADAQAMAGNIDNARSAASRIDAKAAVVLEYWGRAK